MIEETVEQYIRKIAHNRYQMRQHFKWRLNDTADDDWNYAKEFVLKELYQERMRLLEDKPDS